MISSCDKIWFMVIILLLTTNLMRYGVTFDSEEAHTYDDKSNLYHTSTNGDYMYTVTIDPESDKAVDDKSCNPTLDATVPCKTLNYAFEQFSDLSDVKFYLNSPSFIYPLSITPNFTNINKIGIFGNGSLYPVLPIVECRPGTGLTFLNSDNIDLESVHFHKCNASQNSTSRDLSTPHSMLKIQAALYFYNCTNVSMYQVSVNRSQATGVIMYDVNGQVEVKSCNFTNNTAPVEGRICEGHGGGGFAVEFTFCHPGDSSCTYDNYQYDIRSPKRNKNASYVFQNCYFHNNFACGQTTIDYGAWLLSSNASHQAIGRGGGLCVYLKGDATNNAITVSNCVFEHNHAVFGGGLFVEMEDNSNGNLVNILDSVFLHNHAFIITEWGTGGGGLFVCACTYSSPWNNNPVTPSKSSQGNIYINNCTFTKNHALRGGSVLLSLTRQSTSQLNNDHVMVISNSTFEVNRGQLGTALYVGIFPAITRGYVPRVIVDNCSFYGNVLEYHNEIVHTAGVGTIYTNGVPLSFMNQVNFSHNTGSALAAVGTYLNFTKSTALFHYNHGTRGAGIALLGTATILVGEETMLSFTGNHASQYGGAIYNQYSIREDLKSTTHCFILYEIPFRDPKNWTATFKFLNNKADAQGHAIFSSAILPCSFGVSNATEIFCWNDTYWNYGDSNCTEQIYTKPMEFSQNGTNNLSTPVDVYPGYQFRLPLMAKDDLDHEVTNDTLYYAHIYIRESNSTAQVRSGFSHVASNYISIAGSPGERNITLSLETEGSRIMNIKLNLTLVDCPPGMNIISTVNETVCACSETLTYGEYLKCSLEEFHSLIQAGKWLGEIDGELLMGSIPQPYRQATKEIYVSLPKKKEELNTHLCGNMNRNDSLCGRCIKGYAVAVNSPSYTCVPCRDIPFTKFVGRLFAYIALTYGTIFLLFLAIIFLNFKLTSSAAMGFVLYAQMVGSEVFSLKPNALVSNNHYVQVEKAYMAIYGIFNLNSLSFLMKPFCLNERFNTLDVICLDYAIAGFPLIMIALIYFTIRCISRFRCPRRHRQQLQAPSLNNNQPQRSPTNNLVHAFSAFMFLSYTKFCLASMKTMAMVQLFDAQERYQVRRISLAGQWKFTDHEFLFPYGILAIFVFIFAVLLPPFLLLGPIQLIDWLIEKPHFQFLRKIWPSIAIHTILDTFQGFYRPGCRFFGGVFVLFRLVVFISYSFEDSIDQHYAIQQIAIVVLICLIALFRPYSEDFHNQVNTLIFLNLSILNTFAIFMYADSTKHFSSKIYTLQCILVWLPLIYIICYAIWRRIHNQKPYQKVKSEVRKRLRLRLVSPISPQSEEGTTDENECLNPDSPYDDSIPIDEDEGIFQRATTKNRYRPMKARHSSSVTYSEVDPPYCPENKPKMEEEFSTGDSGAGTGTGRSSGIDTK